VRLFANKVQAELTHVRDTVAWIQSWESSQILSFAGPMYERPYNLALSSERERERDTEQWEKKLAEEEEKDEETDEGDKNATANAAYLSPFRRLLEEERKDESRGHDERIRKQEGR
jgi:hypothetical protein